MMELHPFERDVASVLFIGAGAPWAGGAGFLGRQMQFIEALRAVAHVRLLMIETGCTSPPPAGWDVRTVRYPSRHRPGRLKRLIQDMTSTSPSSLRWWNTFTLREAVRQERPDEFDAVFAYRIDHAYLAGVLGHRRLLLDIDEPEHIRRRRRYELSGASSWRMERDLRLLERFEKAASREALASFVCQEGDARAFGEADPFIVPNCVHVPHAITCAGASAEPVVMMLGNFSGAPDSPNVDGLRWFCEDVWPRVHAARPDARLEVVGRCGKRLRGELGETEGVVFRGFVASLDEVFRRAALSVAPIRFGTGTRVKILESMAHGCPVVTTTPGCDGLDVVFGRDLLVADEPELLASTCLRVLGDGELQRRVGAAGRSVVEERYDRTTQHGMLVLMLANLLSVPHEVAGVAA